jgi:hypothetical protein
VSGLEAAGHGDEKAAAAAFEKSGCRWTAFSGTAVETYRLALFRLRRSAAANRMSQAFDRAVPYWWFELRQKAFADGGHPELIEQIVAAALELGGPDFRPGKSPVEQLDEAIRLIKDADAASSRP